MPCKHFTLLPLTVADKENDETGIKNIEGFSGNPGYGKPVY